MNTQHRSPGVCFYFQVHQPYRLRDLRVTELGNGKLDYFDEEKNRTIFRKVAEKCYLPTNRLMLNLLGAHPDFRIAYSLSGSFLDQCREYGADVLDSFRALAATGQVEFLAETYDHSLCSLTSLPEFCDQVARHVRTIQDLFGQTPTTFRNTELIYSNAIAQIARLMGFDTILAEGADFLLHGRSANVPYSPPRFRLPRGQEKIIADHRPLPKRSESITVLLKNYRLSDDVAFRFSNRNWSGYPLYAETYADWIASSVGESVNLFMDYETFGEHQWADTGIFDFLSTLPESFKKRGIATRTPRDTARQWNGQKEIYDAHVPVSWADIERDLSAWLGNPIQQSATDQLYAMEADVKASNDPSILCDWRRLQTSDHAYYMCTKYWNDGDVHKYFSPYDSPYEAYRRFSHALHDLQLRLESIRNHESGILQNAQNSKSKIQNS